MICRLDFIASETRPIHGFLFPLAVVTISSLTVNLDPVAAINLTARLHLADQALVNRAARASRPCGIDASRKSRYALRVRNKKPGL